MCSIPDWSPQQTALVCSPRDLQMFPQAGLNGRSAPFHIAGPCPRPRQSQTVVCECPCHRIFIVGTGLLPCRSLLPCCAILFALQSTACSISWLVSSLAGCDMAPVVGTSHLRRPESCGASRSGSPCYLSHALNPAPCARLATVNFESHQICPASINSWPGCM